MQVIVMQVMMRSYHPDPHHAEMRWKSVRPEHRHYLLAKERKYLRMQRQKMGLQQVFIHQDPRPTVQGG
jgi:hypothetical protein